MQECIVMGRKLYVGNIPYETNEQDLQDLFAQAGAVETITVMRDRDTGRARGFAFVEMANDDAAQKAITELNGQQFGGRRLTVNEAKPPAPRAGGGGGGGFGNRGPSRRSEPRW
jgi:cold-inducible RNA-binding protein